jgi:hypothetical protein
MTSHIVEFSRDGRRCSLVGSALLGLSRRTAGPASLALFVLVEAGSGRT